jgi:hypothetical protein
VPNRTRMGRVVATTTSALLIACSGSLRDGTATRSIDPAPSTPSTAVDVIARSLDAPPPGCQGPPPQLEMVARYFGPLAGGSPIWGGFYARFDEQANAFSAGTKPRRTKDGWAVKVLWVIEPGVLTPVTLSGGDVATGAPLRFAIGDVHASATGVSHSRPETPRDPGPGRGVEGVSLGPPLPVRGLLRPHRLLGRWKLADGLRVRSVVAPTSREGARTLPLDPAPPTGRLDALGTRHRATSAALG